MNRDKDPDHQYRRKAKILRNEIAALKPDAITRARNVYHDLWNAIDLEVPDHMGLQRCQHVIAVEAGFKDWHALINKDNAV